MSLSAVLLCASLASCITKNVDLFPELWRRLSPKRLRCEFRSKDFVIEQSAFFVVERFLPNFLFLFAVKSIVEY